METINDFESYILVVGGGITGYYAAQFLANSGRKVLIVYPSEIFTTSQKVFINGSLDSTYSDAHGKRGLSKFWEFQLMRPSNFAEEEFNCSSKPEFSFSELFAYEEIQLQKELRLKSFSKARLPRSHRRIEHDFNPVLSQFLSHAVYRNIFNVSTNSDISVFDDLVVESFSYDKEKDCFITTVSDCDSNKVNILCKSIVLAAGTLGNAQILNATRQIHDDIVWPTLGNCLTDHRIIDLGRFHSISKRSPRFKVPTFHKNGQDWKIKYQIPESIQNDRKLPNSAVEITPMFVYRNGGKGFFNYIIKFQNLFNRRMNLLFGFSFGNKHPDIHCVLLAEDPSANLMTLKFAENGISVETKSENLELFKAAKNYVVSSLRALGYEPKNTKNLEIVSAYHLMGSTPIGESSETSVVDVNGSLYGFPRVKVLGLSSMPMVGYVNPTYSALVFSRIFLKDLVSNS